MKKIIGIYKITSPKNKIYIGQSTDINKRFHHYKYYDCKAQKHLHASFIKYGYNSHKFEIVHECLLEELNDLEIYYIELFQCHNSKYGLNLVPGGNNGTGLNNKGKKHPYTPRPSLKGRPQSQEHINKRLESRKGFKHSEESKEKIRIKRAIQGVPPQSKESRKRQGKKTKGHPGYKPFKFKEYFEYIKNNIDIKTKSQISIELNIPMTTLCRMVRKLKKEQLIKLI